MLGAIHNGHNVIAKFHHGTNRGSINDLPDEAYLCLLGIDKRQINLDAVNYFQLPTQGPFNFKKGKAIIAKISSSNDRLIYFNEIKYWLLENDIFFFCAFERSSKSFNMQNINVLFKKFLILLI